MHDRDHEAINGKSAAKIDWFIWKWNTLFERFRFVGFTAHRWRVLKITPVIHEIDKKGSLVPDEQLGQLLAWVVRATIVRLSKIIVRLVTSVTFFGFFFYCTVQVVFHLWSDVEWRRHFASCERPFTFVRVTMI